MKKILIDIDGVLADFYKGFADFLNTNYGTTLNVDTEPKSYDFDRWGSGTESVNFEQAMNEWIRQGGYFALPIYDGAAEFFNSISGKLDVYVVTARDDENLASDSDIFNQVKRDTIKWFKAHGVKAKNIHFKYNKISFCEDHGISILIEDKLSTAVSGAKKGFDTILINRNWNQGPNKFRVHRVSSYTDALKVLENLL